MDTTKFYDFWRVWFAQPEAEKQKHLRQSGKGGWYPPGSEAPGYEAEADPKEYFHWRLNIRNRPSNFATTEIFKKCLAEARMWLYARGMEQLADLPSENHVLRILHYPPTPDGNVGQAHVDFDLLTVSVPGTVPGLEVFDIDEGRGQDDYEDSNGIDVYAGHWRKRETFEVHVGEMMQIYADARPLFDFSGAKTREGWGLYKATPHRVRTPPNTERFKAVFFYLPPMDFELKPGFTARDYLYGPKGTMVRAGTSEIGR